MKKIITSIVASVVIFITAFLGFSNILKQKINDQKYADWMKSLDDDLSLREVSMPGSHDTMALYSIADLAGQCQSLSLEEQLNLGVRFLDIRLKEENNKLKAVHGFIDQKASFAQITKVVESFLNKHTNEFLIMSIKEEAAASSSSLSFEDCLKTYLGSDKYLKDTLLPEKVGDARGKVILLSRYQNSTIGVPAFKEWKDSASFVMNANDIYIQLSRYQNSTIGVPAYSEWKDSTSFTMSENDIYVQDTYKITSKEQKQEEIVKCFNESGHALKINFLSAYRTNAFPPSYAVSAAKDINPWINEEISKYQDRGIVLYDFVTKENMYYFFKGILWN